METLANLESFVRSAESGSFSAAARRLALSPAAVSRNVARLEANLGLRLFQRSTRRLTLTEAGERFLGQVGGALDQVQAAIAAATTERGEPAGTLKLSLAPGLGMDHVLPLLPAFLARYPAVLPDWHFDNRAVDLVGEGFDAAIGGGFELTPGVVARTLAPVHVVAVAAPAWLATQQSGRRPPRSPEDLAGWDGIVMRSRQSGKLRDLRLRDRQGRELALPLKPRVVLGDPEAVCRATLLGLGVALLAMPHAEPHLAAGRLQRVLPQWWADAGRLSLYHPGGRLVPAKTRVFVDFVVQAFGEQQLARRWRAD